MARSGFRSPRRSFRFRGTPFARKKLIWCTQKVSVSELAGNVSSVVLLVPQQWQLNTTSGDLEHAKILRLVLHATATQVATAEDRLYCLGVNDINQAALDPTQVATYGDSEPFHLGVLNVPPTTNAGRVTNNFPDSMRVFKVNRKIRSDMNLNLWVQPAAAAPNQVTFTFLARVLVQLD